MTIAGKQLVIVIAAGGTGGHIFPAIATGNKLQELAPQSRIIYACGERPLEVGLYERNAIQPVVFPARQIRPGIAGKIGGVLAAGGNVFRAMQWLRSVKADIVIGFGGYVAGPTVLAGKLVGCKTAIHEANSIPGRTNRILGPWMNLTASHFESTLTKLGAKNQVALGMPIRTMEAAESWADASQILGLDPERETILIMGGSQGAKFLYQSILEQLPALDKAVRGPVQVLWSTGENNLAELKLQAEKLELQNIKLHLVPFIVDMGNALRATDLAVARAGASALAELTAFRVYTLYVPFPGAIYDHQTLNAKDAEHYGLGKVIAEKDVKERLIPEMSTALEKVRSGYRPDPPEALDSSKAADRLAEKVLELVPDR